MELTQEQKDIIQSTGNIRINAVAGSGKTTTVIEYARSRPKESRILYLAFNKSVKTDALQKFASKGLRNVKVETAHSLAHSHIVQKSNYKVRSQDYKTYELIDILGISISGEKLIGHIVANHINKFVAYFCNSQAYKVRDLNYSDVISDSKAKAFVLQYYSYIETKTRLLLTKMNNAVIDITHDFYLKKFQLSHPQLVFDYILFDEGQDASPAMLDVFFNQKAVKVIVGDTHQQIYGWRYAVNSLDKANYKTYYLTKSFRFSQHIANLAMRILSWKSIVTDSFDEKNIEMSGVGCSIDTHVKAVLARTNLGLLLKAIEYITEKKSIKKIYFEGNINSYTYAENGTSLYDVLNLSLGKPHLIKDKLIASMNDLSELDEYVDKTGDGQIAMLVEVVKEYGKDIPEIIKDLKSKHVDNKKDAQIIFSTIHRCKGMEYDTVQLVSDFIKDDELNRIKIQSESVQNDKLIEEINLLYVAVTRTRNSIYIPETLLPEGFEYSKQIHKLAVKSNSVQHTETVEKTFDTTHSASINKDDSTVRKYNYEDIRQKYSDAYKPWTIVLDNELEIMYSEGISVKDLAKHFGRSKGAIRSKIKKMELKEP